MIVQSIKTPLFKTGSDLVAFILDAIPPSDVRSGMVLAVTSKIVSLAENRVIEKDAVASKQELVRQECDHYLGEVGYAMSLTVVQGMLMAAAGIDESNSEFDQYILYPKDPYLSAKSLWEELKMHWKISDLGIILTDSHTTPLRRGVTGVGLSFWGFEPVENLVGEKDLFGRPFKVTSINRVDALASAAVYEMGEGTLPKPLALIYSSGVRFSEMDHRKDLQIPLEDDLYAPLLKNLIQGQR